QLTRWYRVVLRMALRHQWYVVPTSVALAASALVFAFGVDMPLPGWVTNISGLSRLSIKPVGKELVPSEDQNRFIMIVICPVGSSIDYVDEMLQKGEDILINLRDPEGREVVAGCFAAISIRPGSLISEGTLFCRLVPAEKRSWTQTEVMNEAR